MPRELVAVAPGQPRLRAYQDDAPLRPGEIRVLTEYGAPKHGTELGLYHGDRWPAGMHWDEAQRLVLPGAPLTSQFPFPLGNMAVGRVLEVGPAVTGIAAGQRVVGYGPLRELQRWRWDPGAAAPVRLLPAAMPWQAAVCLDPATVALGGIRDGHVRLGDRVAVFGLGAIGLLVVQLARLAGAALVVAVDPLALRRTLAAETGADLVLDPTMTDVGLTIKDYTGGVGVDVALEASGSAQAVHHAIRGLAYGGTVALLAVYKEFRGGLTLGYEAHHNRPHLVFPRAESEPHDDHPRWDRRRQAAAAWALLAAGQLRCQPLVQPVVAFDAVVAAYRAIDEHPEHSIKLGVRFAAAPDQSE